MKRLSDSRVIYIGGKISSSPLKIFNGKFEHKTIITKVNEAASKVPTRAMLTQFLNIEK